jgi:hypothetical protein
MEKNIKYCLFLDDYRMPEDCFEYMRHIVYILEDWVVVRCYDEFIRYIQENDMPVMISFDHDISYDDDSIPEKTGYDCAKWLINYCIDNKKELPATILVHSKNFAGSQNIISLFTTYYKSLNLPSST